MGVVWWRLIMVGGRNQFWPFYSVGVKRLVNRKWAHPPGQTSATTVRRDANLDVWDTWGASCSLNPPGGYGSGRYGSLLVRGGSTTYQLTGDARDDD